MRYVRGRRHPRGRRRPSSPARSPPATASSGPPGARSSIGCRRTTAGSGSCALCRFPSRHHLTAESYRFPASRHGDRRRRAVGARRLRRPPRLAGRRAHGARSWRPPRCHSRHARSPRPRAACGSRDRSRTSSRRLDPRTSRVVQLHPGRSRCRRGRRRRRLPSGSRAGWTGPSRASTRPRIGSSPPSTSTASRARLPSAAGGVWVTADGSVADRAARLPASSLALRAVDRVRLCGSDDPIRIGVLADCQGPFRGLQDGAARGCRAAVPPAGSASCREGAERRSDARSRWGADVELVQGCVETGEHTVFIEEARRLVEREQRRCSSGVGGERRRTRSSAAAIRTSPS